MTTPSGSACVPCRSSETTFCVVTVLILALLAESLVKENGLVLREKKARNTVRAKTSITLSVMNVGKGQGFTY